MTVEPSQDTGLPPFDLPIDGVNDYCDECEHVAITAPRRPSWLRSKLGLSPRAATCRVRVEDYAGIGSVECGCDNPKHGS